MMDQGIGSWPRRRARMEPDAIALIQQDRRVDYATLADRVDALAAALADFGVVPGARVAYLGHNDIATFETLFATMHLGAIFVALNTRLAAPEIAGLLDDADPTVFVVGADTGIDALARSSATPRLLHLGAEYENAINDHTGRT